MKDTKVGLASVELSTVENEIKSERIKWEVPDGTATLQEGIQIRLNWPGSIQLCKGDIDYDPRVVVFEDEMEVPHGITVEVLFTDLVGHDPDDIARVALGKVATLKIYVDITDDRITFELISPRGAIFGAQSVPLSEYKDFFNVKEG